MAPKVLNLRAPNGKRWKQPTGLFIANEFVDSSEPTNTITSIDPATELEIATVQAATSDDVDRAVKAAKTALKNASWKSLSGTDRGRLMLRLADLIEENKELLATIDAWDNGKSVLGNISITCPVVN
jgi:aldehyde dehydrogenase (NAD+)